jgi:aryl-alcohol dehydrogenase-like predicted oxidoreductase
MMYLDEAMRQWHVRTRLPVVAYSSQAGGYFGQENVAWAKCGFAGPPPKRKEYDTPSNRGRLSRAIELAGQKGVTANQIALAYLLHQPFVVFPIVGTSRPEHVREALAASSVQLSHQECAFLSEHVRRVGPACEETG